MYWLIYFLPLYTNTNDEKLRWRVFIVSEWISWIFNQGFFKYMQVSLWHLKVCCYWYTSTPSCVSLLRTWNILPDFIYLIVVFMFLNNITGIRMTEFLITCLLLYIKSIKLSLDGYISLNSFGYGGANGHLVLKPYRNHSSNQGGLLKQAGFIVVIWLMILWRYLINDFVTLFG